MILNLKRTDPNDILLQNYQKPGQFEGNTLVINR